MSVNRENYEEYTIKRGDGLMAIARRLYNEPQKYKEFLDEQGKPITNPDRIEEGQKILIPKRGGTSGGDKYDTYTIKRGDGLMAIARKLYNDPQKYKEFLDEQGKSITNPDRIQEGQKILIPKAGRVK